MASSTTVTALNASTTLSGDFAVYLVSAALGSITLTLPDVSNAEGYCINIKRVDTTANTVTIKGFTASQLVDGVASFNLGGGRAVTYAPYAANWFSINN